MFTVLGYLFLTSGLMFRWAGLHPIFAIICFVAALGAFVEAILSKFRSNDEE